MTNEASVWRHALAQQIAPHYIANPKVRAVAVAGSVAQGYADRSSDIDLSVFWAEPPTGKERRDIIKWAGGRRRPRFRRSRRSRWVVRAVRGSRRPHRRVAHDSRGHRSSPDGCAGHADPSLPKQRYIAALLCALPLSDPSMLTHWQQQALVYPLKLSVSMVRAHLHFRPGWEREVLAERQ